MREGESRWQSPVRSVTEQQFEQAFLSCKLSIATRSKINDISGYPCRSFPSFFHALLFFLHLWNSVTWNGHFYSTESALFFNRLVSPPRLKTTNFLGPRITHTFLGFVVSAPHNTPGIRGWAVRQ